MEQPPQPQQEPSWKRHLKIAAGVLGGAVAVGAAGYIAKERYDQRKFYGKPKSTEVLWESPDDLPGPSRRGPLTHVSMGAARIGHVPGQISSVMDDIDHRYGTLNSMLMYGRSKVPYKGKGKGKALFP